ncbi:MAG: right-handed parallel beta-helix repeat-containing protein [Treponema sp.]|nr:right-handed parallel beta-helix repeat-containing protein [Treponema sp.]
MKKLIVITFLAAVVLLFSSQARTTVQEVRVSSNRNTTLVNGFRSNATNYEIVNLPQYDRTNVIKINGRDCDWNVISFPMIPHRGKPIIINFSVDVMRTGTSGELRWSVNNEPEYPTVALLGNAEVGVWYNINKTIRITPSGREPLLYLTTWGNDYQNTVYYFDNLNVTINTLNWDYTPTSRVSNVGERAGSNARNIYVSASKGSDSGNGSQARPFQKIANAMHYVRAGDTVLVDSGTYHEKFKIPSGNANRPVTLTAMPGAEVIITPTIPITPEWRQHTRNIWVADISAWVKDMDTEFPQLFIDGDSMVEARFPNMGSSMSLIMDQRRDVAQRGTNKNTVVASQDIPSNIASARLVIWPGENNLSAWSSNFSIVRSVSGRTIKLTDDITGSNPGHPGEDPYTPHPGNAYFITGALALLDAPGEYFFDRQTNLLYFYPPWNGRPDQSPNGGTLSMRHFNNIAIQAENTSHVIIKNINIYGGGISMENSRNNTIENCRIKYAEHFYLSGDATQFAMYVSGSNNRISGCEFGFTAGNGITLEGENIIFTNNIIHNFNYAGKDLAGVFLRQSSNMEISHNTFLNAAKAHIYSQPNHILNRNIIRNNHFENHSILNSDCSAFYTWGSEGGGTEIYNNFVVSGNKGTNGTMAHLRFGLYVDNYSKNYIVRHNVVIGGMYGLCINLPNEGTQAFNNTLVGAQTGIQFYGYSIDNADARTITVKDNLFVNTRTNDIAYYAHENSRFVSYEGNFINGTIPVTQRPEGRMQSSGNARGTVDAQYRPTGNTPNIGAIPRDGQMFAYGADWQLGERR